MFKFIPPVEAKGWDTASNGSSSPNATSVASNDSNMCSVSTPPSLLQEIGQSIANYWDVSQSQMLEEEMLLAGGENSFEQSLLSLQPRVLERTTKSFKRKADTEPSSGVSQVEFSDSEENTEDDLFEVLKVCKKSGRGIEKTENPRKRIKKLSRPMKACNDIFKELMSKKLKDYAWPFLTPVEPEVLGIPDYFDVIKKPMDLGTVKTKMDLQQYNSLKEFSDDVRLIFTNCYKYNPADHEIVAMARRVQCVFEKKLAKVSSDAVSEDDFYEKIRAVQKECKKMKKEFETFKKIKANQEKKLRRKMDRKIHNQGENKSAVARAPPAARVCNEKKDDVVPTGGPIPMPFEEKQQLKSNVDNVRGKPPDCD